MASTIAAASEICSGAYMLVPVACYIFGVATGILLLLFDHKHILLFGGRRGSLCKQGCVSELGRSSEAAPQPDMAPQRSASSLSCCATSCHSSSSLDDAALLASAPNTKPLTQPLSLRRRRRPNLPAIDVNDHTDALGRRSGSQHYVKVEIPDASSRAATSAHLACTDDFGRSPSAPDETKMKRIRDMWLSQRQRCSHDGQDCCGPDPIMQAAEGKPTTQRQLAPATSRSALSRCTENESAAPSPHPSPAKIGVGRISPDSGASRNAVSQREAHWQCTDATPRQISRTRPMRRSESESALFQGPDILESRTSSSNSPTSSNSPCDKPVSRSESVRYLGPGIFKSNTTTRQWSRSEASLSPATEQSVKKSPGHRAAAKSQASFSRTGSRHGASPSHKASSISKPPMSSSSRFYAEVVSRQAALQNTGILYATLAKDLPTSAAREIYNI